MDDGLSRFREAADRENAERPVRRRYSPTLQREAVAYWQHRRGQEGMRAVAAALGVSMTTLQRWTRGAAPRPHTVLAAAPSGAARPRAAVSAGAADRGDAARAAA